jgi:hypothetical protein
MLTIKQIQKNVNGTKTWCTFELKNELYKFLKDDCGINSTTILTNSVKNYSYSFNAYLNLMYREYTKTQCLSDKSIVFYYSYQNLIKKMPKKTIRINGVDTPVFMVIREFWKKMGVLYYYKYKRTLVSGQKANAVDFFFNQEIFKNPEQTFEIDLSGIKKRFDLKFDHNYFTNLNIYKENIEEEEVYHKLLKILGEDITIEFDLVNKAIEGNYTDYLAFKKPYKIKKQYYHDFLGDLKGYYYKEYYFDQFKCLNSWERLFNFDNQVKYTIDKRTNRLYTYFTFLPKEVRDTFLLDSKPIEELDVANCQPLLFNILVSEYENEFGLTEEEKMETNYFRRLTENGGFYAKIVEEYTSYQQARCRENKVPLSAFKVEFFAAAFFSKDFDKNDNAIKNNPLKNFFAEKYPTLYRIASHYKSNASNNLAILLQKIEAEIMISGIAKRLLSFDIKTITCHDGIYVNPEHIEVAIVITKEVFLEHGLNVTIKNKTKQAYQQNEAA